MSWASRRRSAYGFGVFLFFFIVIGVPVAYWYFTIPATCTDGIQNQGETSPDHGGPCALLDTQSLLPAPVLWARSFMVRNGSYNTVAYIQNTNKDAGVVKVPYKISLYDASNVLIAERVGSTFIMPESITPVFQPAIDTGNRVAVHTYFNFTEPAVWRRMQDRSRSVIINDVEPSDVNSTPHLTATAYNSSVRDITNVVFVATVFDQAGNAFATSQTTLPKLHASEKQTLSFTWPSPFEVTIGRIDIIPLVEPVVEK